METICFIATAQELVKDYYKEVQNIHIEDENILLISYSKTLQNNTCMMLGRAKRTLFFIITYDEDEEQIYVDIYSNLSKRTYQRKYNLKNEKENTDFKNTTTEEVKSK